MTVASNLTETDPDGASDRVYGNRELPFGGIEVDTLHVPRCHDSQGGFKKLIRDGSLCLAWLDAAFCRNQPCSRLSIHGASRARCAALSPALDPPNCPLGIQKRHK
jgi:hypothetical protein